METFRELYVMEKKTVKPLGEFILVRPEKEKVQSKSGLVLPESSDQERPQQGKIIAVGDSEKIKVKKNDTVIFAKYSGTEIKINKEDLLIIKNEDVLAVLE